MGYSWNLETESANELYNLIKSYKGEIYVFERTIGEIKSALDNAANYLKRRQPIKDLELRIGVELQNLDYFDLNIDNDTLRNIIEKDLKIKIQPDIEWENERNHKYNLDTEKIIEYISKPYETLLDQYAGSGNFVIACYNKNRNSIAIEKDNEIFSKMKDNIEENLGVTFDEIEYE